MICVRACSEDIGVFVNSIVSVVGHLLSLWRVDVGGIDSKITLKSGFE